MGFAQAPLRVQRGGPADRRRGLRRTRTRDAVAQPGPGRQPAVQGQPAIGAGDGMDADAAGWRTRVSTAAWPRAAAPAARSPGARPRPPVPPASTRRRRARAGTRSDSATTHDLYSCNFPDYTSAPVWPGACIFKPGGRTQNGPHAAGHALQYRFAGRAANPGGALMRHREPPCPLRLPVPPASRGPRGQPGPTPRASG